MQDVAYIERGKVGVGLQHQRYGSSHAWRGHARSTERHITIARVVLSRHDVRANKGKVGLDSAFFGWALTAVNGDSGVLIERSDRDDVFS